MQVYQISKFEHILAHENKIRNCKWKLSDDKFVAFPSFEEIYVMTPCLTNSLFLMGTMTYLPKENCYVLPHKRWPRTQRVTKKNMISLEELEFNKMLISIMKETFWKEFKSLDKLDAWLAYKRLFLLEPRHCSTPTEIWIGMRNSQKYMRYIQYDAQDIEKNKMFTKSLYFLCGLNGLEVPMYNTEEFRKIVSRFHDWEIKSVEGIIKKVTKELSQNQIGE